MSGDSGHREAADAEMIDAVSSKARALLSSGKRREAIATLDSASEDDSGAPASVRAHLAFIAGTFLRGFGQDDAAIVRFERSVGAEQSNAQHWLGLAGALVDARRLSEAARAVEQALSLSRADSVWWWVEPQALGVHGRYLLAVGDQVNAVALLKVFRTRMSNGVPPNPWCDLQLVADLLARGVELEQCRAYLNAVAAHAVATSDADLEWRVRPLIEKAHA